MPEATSKISERDPRAYLIRFRQQKAQQNHSEANGLTRTGLRIRRAKTTRLPLEGVPVDARLHDVAIAMRMVDDINGIKRSFARLSTIDEYIRSGTVESIVWSPLSKEVADWEHTVKQLVQSKYHSRVLEGRGGDAASNADPPVGVFDFEMNLSRVLKAFVDGDGD